MATSRPRKHWPGPRPLDLHQQRARMLYGWPGFSCRIRRNTMVCRGAVKPNPIAGLYRIRVEYVVGGAPMVWVEDPLLSPREGKPIPHVYREDGIPRPCLYYPGYREWRSDMALATTIMAWLLVWLTAYEVWHATGQWYGGGIEHDEDEVVPTKDVA